MPRVHICNSECSNFYPLDYDKNKIKKKQLEEDHSFSRESQECGVIGPGTNYEHCIEVRSFTSRRTYTYVYGEVCYIYSSISIGGLGVMQGL